MVRKSPEGCEFQHGLGRQMAGKVIFQSSRYWSPIFELETNEAAKGKG